MYISHNHLRNQTSFNQISKTELDIQYFDFLPICGRCPLNPVELSESYGISLFLLNIDHKYWFSNRMSIEAFT